MKNKLTTEQANWLDDLYSHLNEWMFQGLLPQIYIFVSDRVDIGDSYLRTFAKTSKNSDEFNHEIYINRELFNGEIVEIYKAVIRQQLRLWQYCKGKRPKLGYSYYDKQLAELAKAKGVIMKGVGADDGKDYGRHVELYIEHGGLAMKALKSLPVTLRLVPFKSRSDNFEENPNRKPKREILECTECGWNGGFTGLNQGFKYCPMCTADLLDKMKAEQTIIVRSR